ncbi:MAG: VCBS repeat-containing protein, partial [Acidobacteriota bacterium]
MRRACRPSPAWLRWAFPVCTVALLGPPPAAGQSCAAPSVGTPMVVPVGTGPWGAVVGDFEDRDGKLDVVVTQDAAGTVALYKGDGFGGLTYALDFSPVANPRDIVSADFNLDGFLDLVVAGPGSLLGVGEGSASGFVAAPSPDVGDSPSRLVVADFNRDGAPDVAVTSQSAGYVRVFLGNGDLTFTAYDYSPPFAFNDLPVPGATALVAGDFDRDGNPDLAVTTSANQVAVFLGDGTGFLGDGSGNPTAKATIGVGTNPLDIAAGDVDRDGKPDLVTANQGSGTASVLIGDGLGGFTLESPAVSVGSDPVQVALVDVDRDGWLDLAALLGNTGPPQVRILPGTSTPPPSFDDGSPVMVPLSGSSAPMGLAVGDLERDGRPDLVVTESATNQVVVVPNESGPDCPRASFGDAPRAFFAGNGPVSVAIADLDEDGLDDLVVAASTGQTLEVLKGTGNGYVGAGTVLVTGTIPRGVATADFNFDGHADIVAALGNQVQVFLGDGTGALAGGSSAGAGSPSAVVVGDFDGNGAPDVAATSQGTGEVYFFPGDALGGLGAPTITTVGAGPLALAAGQLNTGGVLDLVVANSADDTVSVLLGNGDGSFAVSTLPMTPGKGPWGIALGNFDGGGLDIVTADHDATPASVTVWSGVGDGTFGAATSFTVPGSFPFAVAALDVTADSNHDISVVTNDDALVLLVGDGAGGFAAPAEFPVRARPSEIAVLDADADGRPDLAVPCRDADSVVVLLARPPVPPLFTEAAKVGVGVDPTDIVTADLDRDGDLDLAAANSTDGTVSVLQNDSLGGFSVSVTLSVGPSPNAVVAADFDRDGILDLAVANRVDPGGTISVLRGLGGGVFDAAESAPPFLPPYASEVLGLPDDLAVGDFDGDGTLELAAANEATGTVTLIGVDPKVPLPAGPPYFDYSFEGTLVVGESPRRILVDDLDRDGKLDLVVVNRENLVAPLDDDLTVFFGDGSGGFTPPLNLQLGSGTSPLSVTSGDFDLDGDPDLAVAVFGSDEIALFTNQGSRIFSSPGASIPASFLPQFLTTADVNRDGKSDLTLAASGLAVRRGQCSLPPPACSLDLAFESSEDFVAGRSPTALVVADFNGDGLPDAALSNKDSDDVSILLSTACVRRRLVVSTSPAACGTGGPPYPLTAVVEVQDDGANKLTCSAGTVAASIAPGTGAPGAVLGGTPNIAVSLGEASFTDLNIDRDGLRYRLQFDLTGVPSALSRSLTLGPDATISGPPSFCGGSSGTYSVGPGYDHYLWTVGGIPASGSPSLLLSNPPLATGPHTLAVEAHVDGCLAVDSKNIYVGDLQSVTISTPGATTVCVDCLGGTVTAIATGGGAPVAQQWGYRTTSGSPTIIPIPGQTTPTYTINGLDFPGVGIFYLVETTTPTCPPASSLTSNEVPVTITASVPSGEVDSLGATSRGPGGVGENVLQWKNTVGNPDEILVRWNKASTGSSICSPPPDPTALPVSGEVVLSGPFSSTTVWTHGPPTFSPLELDTAYCYSVFVRPTAPGPYSPGRTVKARPFDTTSGPIWWAYATGATAVAPPTVGFDGVVALSNDRSVHSLERGINGGTWPSAWVPPILNGVVHSRSPIMPMPTPADPLLLVGDD